MEGVECGEKSFLAEEKSGNGCGIDWLRGVDLNHRPLGYEPNELPDCSTPHFYLGMTHAGCQIVEVCLDFAK